MREEKQIDDLSLRDLVGQGLLKDVLETVAGQELTPRVALDRLSAVENAFASRINMLSGLTKGLSDLGIAKAEPQKGEVEIGLYVPREGGDLPLSEVLEEGEALDALISVGYEIAEGSPQSPEVRALTSSDYGFVLNIDPVVAALLLVAVDRALSLLKKFGETLLVYKQLLDNGDDPADIEALRTKAEARFQKQLHASMLELIKEKGRVDSGRTNELANRLTIEVKKFVNKRSSGTYIDVRFGKIPEKVSEDGALSARTPTAKEAALKEVEETARHIHALERSTEPPSLLAGPKNS